MLFLLALGLWILEQVYRLGVETVGEGKVSGINDIK
jgi:hypothetical protein